MPRPIPSLHFSLEDIQQSAQALLALSPGAIVTWRLLRHVLDLPADHARLADARAAVSDSRWVHQLEAAQLPDGSFGRFHSQDTKQKTIFRTSEGAIDRAFALGLEADHPVLTRLKDYIQQALQGQVHITDPDEKNEAWPLLVRFILAGRLAQIAPADTLITPFWQYLEEVARSAFSSGSYRLEDEVGVYRRLSGVRLPKGFLESQHALWILSTRPLASPLESALLSWLWSKPDGIRYIRAPLHSPDPSRIGYWVRSVNLLSHFTAWRKASQDILNEIWGLRDEHGWWDFGKQSGRCAEFPLSDSWRQPTHRRMDQSTHILVLLRKCFD
jgi:hypothetical protein